MSTQMSTGPEPTPTGIQPYDYGRWRNPDGTFNAGCAAHDGYHPVGQCDLSQATPTRGADSDTSPVLTGDVIRNAVLAALQEPGALPNREAYQSWDLNLLRYAITDRVTASVMRALRAEAAEETTEDPIRLAVRAALVGHAPAGKEYGPNGQITKICRCGLRTEAATLVPRTQHLEDVVVAALHTTPELVARVAAVVEARRGDAAPLPTRDEVLHVAEAAMREHARHFAANPRSADVPTTAAALLDALHEVGMLAWREDTAGHGTSTKDCDIPGDGITPDVTPAGDEPEDDCPHCSPTHGSPGRCAWGVRIGPEVDGDGQPVYLIVQPTNGAHVAPADVRWLWHLIYSRAGQ